MDQAVELCGIRLGLVLLKKAWGAVGPDRVLVEHVRGW